MFVTLAAVVILGLALQVATLNGLGQRRPIGDEEEYLSRGRAADPHAPQPFLRPPVMPWLARAAHRASSGSHQAETRLRQFVAFISWLTIALTAIAGWLQHGPGVALLAATLLLAQPERLLLANHLWPETLLGAILAALVVLQSQPTCSGTALAIGLLAALGSAIRIDFLIILPCLLLVHAASGLFWQAAVSLAAPSVLLLIGLAMRNLRRYGVALPDTTWAFNLMAAHCEAQRSPSAPPPPSIERPIAEALERWRQLPPPATPREGWTALMALLGSPMGLGRGIVRRLLTLVGPDTFIREKLLPRGAAYPELTDAARRRWSMVLRFSLPALFAVTLTLGVYSQYLPARYAWPTLGLMLVTVLFHARTRNRVAFLPVLSLVAAQLIHQHAWDLASRFESGTLATISGLALTAVALTVALSRIRCSREL